MMRRSTRSTTSCEVESEVYPVRKFWRELDRVSVAVTELTQRSREQQEALRAIIEQRLGASFQVVSDWLEKVHRSMGEMQTLANGVGDLKRLLTNVKARGIGTRSIWVICSKT